MRHLLLSATALAVLIGVPVFAADEPAHPKEHKAESGVAINKLDVNTGKEIDPKAGVLELKWEKKPIVVGFSSKESYESADKADEKTKELIAQAAKTHKLIVDGKLTEIKKHEKKADK